jgi:hypothetical protein
LKHEPATANELELAIAEIEDALAPVIRMLPPNGRLTTSVPAMRDIAKAASPKTIGDPEIGIEAVEILFNRLADVASGTPAARLGIPASKAFAANLLVLRELMHHAGFASMVVLP